MVLTSVFCFANTGTLVPKEVFHYLDTLKNDNHPALYDASYSLLSFLPLWLFKRKKQPNYFCFFPPSKGWKINTLGKQPKFPCCRFVSILGEHQSVQILEIQVMSSLYKVWQVMNTSPTLTNQYKQ